MAISVQWHSRSLLSSNKRTDGRTDGRTEHHIGNEKKSNDLHICNGRCAASSSSPGADLGRLGRLPSLVVSLRSLSLESSTETLLLLLGGRGMSLNGLKLTLHWFGLASLYICAADYAIRATYILLHSCSGCGQTTLRLLNTPVGLRRFTKIFFATSQKAPSMSLPIIKCDSKDGISVLGLVTA